MTDDEILLMAEAWNTMIDRKRCISDAELVAFARAIESRTRASVIGEWFKEGARIERESCIDIVRTEIRPGDDTFTKIALHTVTAKIQARGE